MTSSPEVSRANGRKSRGPRTERGKALASRNGTRHGLFSEKPSLLEGEAFQSFQGIIQGLVDTYQPQNPVEWHLVQQIAMAMLRQHRLWAAEAALAREQTIPEPPKPYTDIKYPERFNPDEAIIEIEAGKKTEYHPDNRKLEREILEEALEKVVTSYFELPTPRAKSFSEAVEHWKSTSLQFLEKVLVKYPCKDFTGFSFEDFRKFFEEEREKGTAFSWLTITARDLQSYKGLLPKFGINQLRSACQRRLDELAQIESEIQQAQQLYQRQCRDREERIKAAKAIPESIERLSRYERHINRQLHDALDRLNQMKEQRQNAPSTGSFCQNCILMEESND